MSDTELPAITLPTPEPPPTAPLETKTLPTQEATLDIPAHTPNTSPPEPEQPALEVSEPSQDTEHATVTAETRYDNAARERAIAKRRAKREEKLQLILAYVREHGSIVNDEIQAAAGVSDNSALTYAKLLVKEGRLVRLGKGVGTRYVLPKDTSA